MKNAATINPLANAFDGIALCYILRAAVTGIRRNYARITTQTEACDYLNDVGYSLDAPEWIPIGRNGKNDGQWRAGSGNEQFNA